MCCPKPGVPGCSCPTWLCTSFFGMTTRWWPYSDWFLVTYGGYPAGGCHPPWYFLIGPTDWYPSSVVAPLPSNCIGTNTFINCVVFQPCDLVWFPEAGKFLDPCILIVLLLVKADCWSACSNGLVLPKTHAPDNLPAYFPPYHSFLVTQLVPLPRPVCVAPLFQTMSSGTMNKFTALDLLCHMTLEVGVVFSETFPEFLG